jgi:hypothetical protein
LNFGDSIIFIALAGGKLFPEITVINNLILNELSVGYVIVIT